MIIAQCNSMGLTVVEDTEEPELVDIKVKI